MKTVSWMVLFAGIFVCGLAARDWIGCASAPPIVTDVATIEVKDAVCIAMHIAEPDPQIVADCSPGGDTATTKAQTLRIVVASCRIMQVWGDAGASVPVPLDAALVPSRPSG